MNKWSNEKVQQVHASVTMYAKQYNIGKGLWIYFTLIFLFKWVITNWRDLIESVISRS